MIVLTYMRIHEEKLPHGRMFGPKPAEAPTTVGKSCVACGVSFAPGDFTTLVPIGPGEDPEARERCRHGRPYNAVAVEVHWLCATGRAEDVIEAP